MQVERVEYNINWKTFKRGSSFLIPCLDAAQTREKILGITKRFKLKVVTKVVIEEGIRGLRVWRV